VTMVRLQAGARVYGQELELGRTMNAVLIRSPFHPLGVRPVANDRECAGCVHDKAKAVTPRAGFEIFS